MEENKEKNKCPLCGAPLHEIEDGLFACDKCKSLHKFNAQHMGNVVVDGTTGAIVIPKKDKDGNPLFPEQII